MFRWISSGAGIGFVAAAVDEHKTGQGMDPFNCDLSVAPVRVLIKKMTNDFYKEGHQEALILRLDHSFHISKPFFKITAKHFIHIHEQANRLEHEVLVARHAPGDHGLTFRLEVELRGVGRFERLAKFELDPNQRVSADCR